MLVGVHLKADATHLAFGQQKDGTQEAHVGQHNLQCHQPSQGIFVSFRIISYDAIRNRVPVLRMIGCPSSVH